MVENSIVVKHNKLIEARYKLTLNEQKLVLYAISRLDIDKEYFEVEIPINEVTQLLGVRKDSYYAEIKKIAGNLISKTINLKSIVNGKKEEIIAGWLSGFKYMESEGRVYIEFSRYLKPYLFQLKEQFTRYELKNILYFRNKYSIRVYELLKQYQSIGKREFEIEKFRQLLGCEDKYSEFKAFSRDVLSKAKKEINNHTDLEIDYEKIIKGRKVVGLKFTIEGKVDVDKMLIDSLYTKEHIEDIKKKSGLEKEKFNSKQVMNLYEIACKKNESIDISPYEYIRINYLNMIEKGTAKKKFAWLKKALEEDYAKATIQISLNCKCDQAN